MIPELQPIRTSPSLLERLSKAGDCPQISTCRVRPLWPSASRVSVHCHMIWGERVCVCPQISTCRVRPLWPSASSRQTRNSIIPSTFAVCGRPQGPHPASGYSRLRASSDGLCLPVGCGRPPGPLPASGYSRPQERAYGLSEYCYNAFWKAFMKRPEGQILTAEPYVGYHRIKNLSYGVGRRILLYRLLFYYLSLHL